MKHVFWGLIFAVLVAHSGALGGGFHYDDAFSVQMNPSIRSWQPLSYFLSPKAASGVYDGAGYRPLTVLSFAVNHVISGLDPFSYLVVNLFLHFAVSWMVFLVGRRILGHSGWAALAAGLYAVHPVNSEAVNYIVARSSLLSTAGALVAFWAFLRWRDGEGRPWFGVSVAMFGLALASKESATAFLIPLAGYLWLFGPRTSGGRPPSDRAVDSTRAPVVIPLGLTQGLRWLKLRSGIIELAPFIAICLVYVAVWWGMVGTKMMADGETAYPAWTFAEIVGRSLLLWVWPHPLGLDHPLTFVTGFNQALAAGLVAAGLGFVGMAVVLRKREPLAVWALLWVLAGFLPLLPLPWATVKALFQENRIAFSAAGLAWLTIVVLRAATATVRTRAGESIWLRGLALIAGILVVGAAISIDRARSGVWNDDRLLWQEVLDHDPDRLAAHLNLGAAHFHSQEVNEADGIFERVVGMAAARGASQYVAEALYNRGVIALARRHEDEAKAFFIQTIAFAPNYLRAKAYLGLGEIDFEKGGLPLAAAEYREVLLLDPRNAPAHAKLGLIAQKIGDDQAAEKSYLLALRYDPDNSEVMNNLGALYGKRRDWSRALEYFEVAVRRDPDNLKNLYNKAAALAGLGMTEEAGEILRDIVPRFPQDAEYDSYRRATMAFQDGLGKGQPTFGAEAH